MTKFILMVFMAGMGLVCGCQPTQTSSSPTSTPVQVIRQVLSQPTRAATIAHTPDVTLVSTVALSQMDDVTDYPIDVSTTMPVPSRVVLDPNSIRSTAFPTEPAPTSDSGPYGWSVELSEAVHAIFNRGQQLGNHSDLFVKVGDSLTVATYVFYPIGWGTYDLRGFVYLEPTIQFFSARRIGNDNAFSRISLAADNGWTTNSVLDPARANPDLCRPAEPPLVCEYRIVKPAIALILLGTNDVAEIDRARFESNMRFILSTSIARGIIPVMTTIPERRGFEAQVAAFNKTIIELANAYELPLLDYHRAMSSLPNDGLSTDGVHPSWPPGDFVEAGNFSTQNLQYGYTMRNLTGVMILDTMRTQLPLTGE